MANNRMSGNLLGLQIDGEFIACEMSCDLNVEVDLLPASPQEAGRWEAFIAGARGWNIAVNAGMLMRMVPESGLPKVLNAFITGGNMAVRFTTKDQDIYPNFTVYGNVLLQNAGISGSVGILAGWNATLKGNGPLNIEINTNMLQAISTNLDDSALLGDGNDNIVVGEQTPTL